MAQNRSYIKPPKSQIPVIQGFKNYVTKWFGNCDFKEVRYICPRTPIYESILKMYGDITSLQEEQEVGGCLGRLPTGDAIIYLVNKHKQGHNLPTYGLLYELIHLAKPELSAEEVDRETSKHLDSAREYASVFAYNATHKRKKPYPK